MKRLNANASGAIAASNEQSVALLAAVDRYPDWYPEVVRGVTVRERDEQRPTLVTARLKVTRGPLARELELTLRVVVGTDAVVLERVPNEPDDPEQFVLRWTFTPAQLALEIDATLDVPAFLPLGTVGQELAQGFLEAARAQLD